MDLLQNPFHILTATTRDNRQKIIALAEERILFLDPNECTQARSDLTNPRKRLSAEIAWMPGTGLKRASEVLRYLESSPRMLFGMDELTQFKNILGADKMIPIAQANLLAAGLSRLSDYSSDDVAEWIVEIAHVFENIDPEVVHTTINGERIVSSFPEITDLSWIETEIQERRHYYRQVITLALNNLPIKEHARAMTRVAVAETSCEKKSRLTLIHNIVGWYERDVQESLEKEEANIEVLDEKIRTAVNAEIQNLTLAQMINQFIQAVKNWDSFAQPIQIIKRSQGLSHDASYRVAGQVRKLAVDLFNKYDKLDFSQQLTNMLQEVFAEVGEIAERTAEDARALDEIAEQRLLLIEAAKKRAEEWRREITYEADVGTFLFKNKLRISPESIEWRGNQWDLDSITRIRWGGTRHSLNGIPTGTTYSIIFDYASIELKDETIYNNFIDRLWRTVGVRLLTEYLEGLRDGRKYRFGSAVISDHGVELERKRLFGSNERVFCRWSELAIWNGAGVFCIGRRGDKKLAASFSYQDEDNINILEAVIRMFWKRGGNKLSDLLDE